MTDDAEYRATYERLRARIDALKNAPPLEKARTFLKDFCAATDGLAEIEEQVQHALQFNAIPVWTGLEGLEAVLGNTTLDPPELVALVQRDANQRRVPPTPEASRSFLGEIVGILRRLLGVENEPERPLLFETDHVFTLPDTEGRVERLLCFDMLRLGGETFAIFVPEGAPLPYTVYKYEMFPEPRMTYELVTDAALRKRVLDAHDPEWDTRSPGR